MKKAAADTIPPHKALLYAVMTAAASDRTISTEEMHGIRGFVHDLPPFRDAGDGWLGEAAQDCGRLLSQPNGVEKVLALIKTSLPDRLRETAYVLAAEIAQSDSALHPDEQRFLAMLADTLGLDMLTCAALERAARARYRKPYD